MTTMAATMSIDCWPCESCALAAVPAKAPRTLVGMPMLASAWLISALALFRFDAFGEVEGNRGRQLAVLVVDRGRRRGLEEPRYRCQRHEVGGAVAEDVAARSRLQGRIGRDRDRGVAGDRRVLRRRFDADGDATAHHRLRRRHIDILQRVRAARVVGRPLHHHVVLVQLGVDGRHLALAEGVVERRVDAVGGEAEATGAVAVDLHHRLHAVVLLVGVDVGHGRLQLHLVGQLAGPGAQVGEVVALQACIGSSSCSSVHRIAHPAPGSGRSRGR